MNTEENIITLSEHIYAIWNSNVENDDLTPITKIILFKKYLRDNHNNLYFLSNDYIDSKIRHQYISEKYCKKWLYHFINKKDPVNDMDLELNVIEPDKFYINYIDYKERKRYLFNENDFRKISIVCLQNSYEFDIDPCPINIKNPYTNKEFSKTELRYFNSRIINMPIVWSMFVDSDYDILTFKYKYHSYLLELCIPNYVEKLNEEDVIDYLLDIFLNERISYCNKCLLSRKYLRNIKVKNALIGWIKYLKLGRQFLYRHRVNLEKIFERFLCACVSSSKDLKDVNNKILLDLTKPFFSVGYKNEKEEKRQYRRRRKDSDMKRRYKTYLKH